MSRILLAALAIVLLGAPPAVAAGDWPWPVSGSVARRFAVGDDPFAAGQHRGIDIAAPAGTAVRSACAGTVTFAGPAGTSGRTVAVACGPLSATYLYLSSIAVRGGAHVGPGSRLGAVGATGRPPGGGPYVHFGVHRTGRPRAYVDPLRLLAGGRPTPPALVPPRPGRRPGLPAVSRERLPVAARLGPAPAGASARALAPGYTLAAGGAVDGAPSRRADGAVSRGLPLGGLWLPAGGVLVLVALTASAVRVGVRAGRRRGVDRPATATGARARAVHASR